MKLYTELPNAYPKAVNNASTGVMQEPDMLFLAQHAAMLPDGDWLIQSSDTGHWSRYSSKKSAEIALRQMWGGPPKHLGSDKIKLFMSVYPPLVAGGLRVPDSKAIAVEFASQTFVNTWVNNVMPANAEAFNDLAIRPAVELFFKMLRESLCNRAGERTLEEMLAIAQGDDPQELEFRFLMNWIAAPLQKVGFNLQTNLWLLGDMGGTGKGTLYSLLTLIYGGENAAKIAAKEIEKGGWNDAIESRLLLCINEINSDSTFDWNTFIAENTTEAMVTIRKRNHHAHDTLNHANYMFFSNREAPRCLNRHDRRNCLIATTNEQETANLAQQMQDWLHSHDDQEVRAFLGALVYVWQQHQVDWNMLKFAPDTDIKMEAQDSVSRDSELHFWLREDPKYPRDVWVRANEMTKHYRAWIGGAKAERMDAPRMGVLLSQLARRGIIMGRKRDKNNNTPREYMVASKSYPVGDESYEPVVVSLKQQ